MKEKEYINHMIFLVTAIYTFFSYINVISTKVNIHLLYMILMLVLIILKLMQKNFEIKVSCIDFLWIIYLIMLCINGFFITNYRSNAAQFIAYNIVVYLTYMCIKSSKNVSSKVLDLFYVCSGIHVCCIILQLIFTNAIMKVNLLILPSSGYQTNALALNNNYYSGITIQPAAAGLFATIFVGIAFIKLITNSEAKPKAIFKLLIGIVALLLTQKRSFLMASLTAIVLIYVFYDPNKNRKKVIKILKIVSVISTVIIITLVFIPETRNIVQRILKTENILSGRELMYDEMKEWLSNNIVLGVGIGTADAKFNYGGHNIYLQTLAETGLVGFCLLYPLLFIIFIENIKVAKELFENANNKEKSILLYSLYMQVILFIYGLTGNPIYDYTFFINFVIVMALPIAIRRRLINEKND